MHITMLRIRCSGRPHSDRRLVASRRFGAFALSSWTSMVCLVTLLLMLFITGINGAAFGPFTPKSTLLGRKQLGRTVSNNHITSKKKKKEHATACNAQPSTANIPSLSNTSSKTFTESSSTTTAETSNSVFLYNELSVSENTKKVKRDSTTNQQQGIDEEDNSLSNQQQQQSTPPPAQKRRSLVLTTAFVLLSGCVLTAKLGILPGLPLELAAAASSSSATTMSPSLLFPTTFASYTNLQIAQDFGTSLLTAVLAFIFVRINTWAVSIGRLEPRDARKIIHTFSAPLFMLFWPMFTAAGGARLFAFSIPTIMAVRLFLAATTPDSKDDFNKTGGKKEQQQQQQRDDESALAAAVSRSGDAKEALGGPFIYVVILASAIMLFWKDTPVGVIALSCMAAGDGMADIVGRRLGKNNKWFFDENKSIAGSLAFFLASFITGMGLLTWMQYLECFTLPLSLMDVSLRVAFISFATAMLEVLPVDGLDDNYTVPLSATLLSLILFS